MPGERARTMLVEPTLEGPHADAVRRFLEVGEDWQLVDGAQLHPDVRIADVAGARPAASAPLVLLVGQGTDPAAAATAARRADAAAVLAWPRDRERLPEVAAGLGPVELDPTAQLRIGGAAGGVGTTTVALALAGLAAWSGTATLVVSHGTVPAPAGPPIAPGDLAGPGAWRAGEPAPGLADLRVLRCSGPPGAARVAAGPAGLVVRDLGVTPEADVVVLRRDRAGLAALEATAAGAAVCLDRGVAGRGAVRRAAGGRRLVVVPWSVRVARAGHARQVPAGLPGSWLRRLARLDPRGAVVHSAGSADPAPAGEAP